MKQHITAEQLNELTDKGKSKLRNWALDMVIDWDYPSDLPYLTIGQMIEFLDEQGVVVDITKIWKGGNIKSLTDDLWLVIKEVLNRL